MSADNTEASSEEMQVSQFVAVRQPQPMHTNAVGPDP
jgi:hypothetical protein